MIRLEPRSSSDQGWTVKATRETIDIAPTATECELKKVPAAGCQLWHAKQYMLEQDSNELRKVQEVNAICSAEEYFISSFLLQAVQLNPLTPN